MNFEQNINYIFEKILKKELFGNHYFIEDILPQPQLFIGKKRKLILFPTKKMIIIDIQNENIKYQNVNKESYCILDDKQSPTSFIEITSQGHLNKLENVLEGELDYKRLNSLKSRLDSNYFVNGVCEAKIIENILIISGYIDNESNYYILYPDGKLSHCSNDFWNYTSYFNQTGEGNGVSFFNIKTGKLLKSFYYKDDLNFDHPVELKEGNSTFLITEHEERTHIIFMDDFSVISFGGTNYKFSKQGILFFPYYGYSGYGNFGLIDCVNKNTIDLEPLKHLFESNTPIDFDLFDIENQFIKYKDKMVQFDRLKNSDNNKVRTIFRKEFLVIGQWNLGFAINEHTISSTLNEDGSFDTMRTELGELLYQYKYCFNRDKEDNISKIVTENLFKLFPSIDFIIPIPASNFNRPFQPVIELVKKISELSKIPIELGYLEKIPTPAIKEINDTKQREKILKNAFSVPDRRCKGKTVLLFDDFYRSGATLNAATKALKEQGDVETVYVLTITKTRTKR